MPEACTGARSNSVVAPAVASVVLTFTQTPRSDGPAALNPLLVALTRSNIFAHTRTKGHERPQIVFVHAHTANPQKRSSNPALPCSALRIKAFEAFPFSPMKFLDSLYKDADRKVVHTGGILPHWPSARQVAVTNQVWFWATNLLDFRQRAIRSECWS